jgi:hypothetical protein
LIIKYLISERIFLIEGIITIVTTVIGFFCIPPYPEESKFLEPAEKAYLLAMLADDQGPSRPHHYDWTVIKSCLVDYKIWLG